MAKRSRADVQYAIDLLWTHQIRRENFALHRQIQQLKTSIAEQKQEQGELRNVAQCADTRALEAHSTIKSISAELVSTRANLEHTATQAEATSKQLPSLSTRVDGFEKTWQSNINDTTLRIERNKTNLRRLQNKQNEIETSVKARFEEVATVLESRLVEECLESLHLRIQVLENHFAQHGPGLDTVSRVGDSIEHISSSHDRRSTGSDNCHEGHPEPQSKEEEEEYMLTQRNIELRDSTADESFDLDRNVTDFSYALYRPLRPLSNDSLRPIAPISKDYAYLLAEISALKQGRYHSNDSYFAEGQSLIDRVSKEQETSVVEKFVEGLYAAGERQQCRQWLDASGWRWEHLGEFLLTATPSVPAHARPKNLSDKLHPAQNLSSQSSSALQGKPLKRQPSQSLVSKPSTMPERLASSLERPRRSTRIAGSQHPYRGHEPEVHKAQNARSSRDTIETQRGQNNAQHRHIHIGEPPRHRPLATSSLSRSPSGSGVSQKPAQRAQMWPPSAQPSSKSRKRHLQRLTLPSTPTRRRGAVVGNGRVRKGTKGPKKRSEPYEWMTAGYVEESDARPADVQLPANPSPESARRRDRAIAASTKRVALPPPDIPILSTSE